MIKAWEQKQKRERWKTAELQLVIALAGGMKKQGGGKLSIFDFAPDLKPEQTPEQSEAMIKAYFVQMAEESKAKKDKK